MALSGSYDYTLTRDDIISEAIKVLGLTAPGNNPPTDWVTSAAKTLEIMVKSWQTENIGLWLNHEACLFLDDSTSEYYDIGPTGDHCTLTPYDTTTSAAATTGDTEITVTSATNISASDVIGIELEDGSMQWTTVDGAPASTTVTLAAALTDDVDSGATVYNYTTIAQRPIGITNVRLRDSNGNDTPLTVLSRSEYMAISDKDSDGTVNSVYYDPQHTNGRLYVWPISDTVESRIFFTAKYPIQDFDAASATADFPIEWGEALIYNLAIRIAPKFMDDINEDRMKYITSVAIDTKNNAMAFDSETTSIYFLPDLSGY